MFRGIILLYFFEKEVRYMAELLDDNWINIDEAANYLGIKPVTLRDWIKKRELNFIPVNKIGKQWKFKKSELDEWIKSGKSAIRRGEIE